MDPGGALGAKVHQQTVLPQQGMLHRHRNSAHPVGTALRTGACVCPWGRQAAEALGGGDAGAQSGSEWQVRASQAALPLQGERTGAHGSRVLAAGLQARADRRSGGPGSPGLSTASELVRPSGLQLQGKMCSLGTVVRAVRALRDPRRAVFMAQWKRTGVFRQSDSPI